MKTFYFDVETDIVTRDNVGLALSGERAVRQEAFQLIADRAADPDLLSRVGACVVRVRDVTGLVVLTIRFVCQADPDAPTP